MRADRMMPLETLLVAITLVKQLNYNGFKNSAGLGLEPQERQAVAVAARNHRQIWIRLTATGTGRPNRAAIYASVLDAMLTPRWLAAWSRIRVQRQGKVSVRRAHPRADRRSTASSVLDAM